VCYCNFWQSGFFSRRPDGMELAASLRDPAVE